MKLYYKDRLVGEYDTVEELYFAMRKDSLKRFVPLTGTYALSKQGNKILYSSNKEKYETDYTIEE